MKRLLLRPLLIAAFLPLGLAAQPVLPPPQLDQLVARIALYPDPLLAQVLTGATYYQQIPDAARWADQNRGLPPPQLAATIQAAPPPFEPSVQALLPFPQILDMMARDMYWTERLGEAFLVQPHQVMDAVQRERRLSYEYGYLRSNPHVLVRYGSYIEILPVGSGVYYVPVYDPAVVYYRPRPGFVVAGAINFGFGVALGVAFRPWGWGVSRFGWGEHRVFINNVVWSRSYGNRATYVHPYSGVHGYRAGPGPRVVEPRRVSPAGGGHVVERREEHRAGPAPAARVPEHRGGGPAPAARPPERHVAPAGGGHVNEHRPAPAAGHPQGEKKKP